MKEEIMRVEYADIVDDDHGAARVEVSLISQHHGQSFSFEIEPKRLYALLQLFGVTRLSKAAGQAVVVTRNTPSELIQSIKSLPCDPYVVVSQE